LTTRNIYHVCHAVRDVVAVTTETNSWSRGDDTDENAIGKQTL
jgi:hypothetical protein